jgi:hypothetical protein
MGIDATAKPSLSVYAKRNKVPKEVMDRLRLDAYVNLDQL